MDRPPNLLEGCDWMWRFLPEFCGTTDIEVAVLGHGVLKMRVFLVEGGSFLSGSYCFSGY